MKKRVVLLFLSVLLVAGCETRHRHVPIVDAFNAKSGYKIYKVKPGDTLLTIAFAQKQDYEYLAQINGLTPPYKIRIGQWLKIKRQKKNIAKRKKEKPLIISAKTRVKNWRWPATGRVVERFSDEPYGNKGVNIAGRLGGPVYSIDKGVVVYSGAGVRGYGNLIIVKHANHLLSAYAFNQRNLTKEGMKVSAGQKIATMGRNNAGQVMLHFELRHAGQPVDPLSYLQ